MCKTFICSAPLFVAFSDSSGAASHPPAGRVPDLRWARRAEACPTPRPTLLLLQAQSCHHLPQLDSGVEAKVESHPCSQPSRLGQETGTFPRSAPLASCGLLRVARPSRALEFSKIPPMQGAGSGNLGMNNCSMASD